MKAEGRDRRKKIKGVVLFWMFVILLFLLPMTLIYVRSSFDQSRRAIKDRNIKTAREMAESTASDFMRSFSTDLNRNYFDPLFQNTSQITTFAGFGNARANLIGDQGQQTMWIVGSSTYSTPGTDQKLRAAKSVSSLVYFRSDLTRFEWLVDMPSLNLSNDLSLPSGTRRFWWDSVWVNGDVHTGTGLTSQSIGSEVWVVNGTFDNQEGANLFDDDFTLFCRKYIGLPPSGSNVRIIETSTPTPLVPTIDIVNPGADGRLNYFETRQSTRIVTNDDLLLNFLGDNTVMITANPLLPGPSWIYNLTATDTLVTVGANLTLHGVITRRQTIVALRDGASIGGNIDIDGDLRYNGSDSASPTRSLAVLADGILKFNSLSNQVVDGFFYSAQNNIQVTDLGTSVRVNGTLFGLITYSGIRLSDSTTVGRLNVVADPNLAQNLPPFLPRRPVVVQWDYTP